MLKFIWNLVIEKKKFEELGVFFITQSFFPPVVLLRHFFFHASLYRELFLNNFFVPAEVWVFWALEDVRESRFVPTKNNRPFFSEKKRKRARNRKWGGLSSLPQRQWPRITWVVVLTGFRFLSNNPHQH